jgi:hypothetical protein
MPHTLSLTRTYPDGTMVTATATADDLPQALSAVDSMAEHHNARQKAAECAPRAPEPKPAPAAPPPPVELVALRAAVDAVVTTEVGRQPEQTITGISNHTRLDVGTVQDSLARLTASGWVTRGRNSVGTCTWSPASGDIATPEPKPAARLYEAGRVHTDSSGKWCRTHPVSAWWTARPITITYDTP